MRLEFKRLGGHGLSLPTRQTTGAAGYDLAAPLPARIEGRQTVMVLLGWAVAIPTGHEGQIRLRSSVALQGLIIPNAPGTIDADYRGELALVLHNLMPYPIHIPAGHRIAQLIVAPIATPEAVEVDVLDITSRGTAGFGSTGRTA